MDNTVLSANYYANTKPKPRETAKTLEALCLVQFTARLNAADQCFIIHFDRLFIEKSKFLYFLEQLRKLGSKASSSSVGDSHQKKVNWLSLQT